MTSKLAPLSGLAFLVLVIAGGLYGGKPPAEQGIKSAEELAAAYAAQGDKLSIAVFLMGVGLVFLVYFGSVLKTRLDAGSAENQCLSRAAFAGVIIFVVGAATDFTLMIAMVEAAKDKVDPLVVQTLSTYWENDYVPFAVGIGAGFLAYVVIKLVRGKAREVHPLMWVVALLFVLYFLLTPLTRLLT